MGLFDKFKKNMDEYVETHAPDEVEEMSPREELREDIKDPLFKSLALCLAVTGFILSGFAIGYVIVFIKCGPDNMDMLLMLKYGFISWWALLLNLLLAGMFVLAAYKIFRATRKNYLRNKKGNYYVSKNNTFSNAHFQTQAEIADNFVRYDSIEDSNGDEIFFADEDGGVYSLRQDEKHYRANFNSLFFGGSGAGKSASTVKTHIYQGLINGESMYVTDTKGDLYKQTVNVAREFGYKVKILNTKSDEFRNSDGFNPLVFISPGNPANAEIAALIADIILQSNGEEDGADSYWYNNSFNLLKCLILYVATDESEIRAGHNNIPHIYTILSNTDVADFRTIFLTGRTPDDPVVQCYNLFSRAKDTVQGQIVNDLGVKLQRFVGESISKVLANNEIDLELPMKRKCIYYVVISDTDTSFASIVSLFFTLSFVKQCSYSDKLTTEEKKKQLPVRYILDEYANCGTGILGLDVRIATIRSRKIWLTIILQDYNQLITMYGEEKAGTILNNCFVTGLLATNELVTAKYISEKLGNQTIMTKSSRMAEGTSDIIRAHVETQNSYSENKRPLMTPEELMNGAFKSDEIIYIIQGMPPVRGLKYFSELSGVKIHPLEIRGAELGERKSSLHKPKWRKILEENKKKAEEEYKRHEQQGDDAVGFEEDDGFIEDAPSEEHSEIEGFMPEYKSGADVEGIGFEDEVGDYNSDLIGEQDDDCIPDLSMFDSDANESVLGESLSPVFVENLEPVKKKEESDQEEDDPTGYKPKGARPYLPKPKEDFTSEQKPKLQFKTVQESNVPAKAPKKNTIPIPDYKPKKESKKPGSKPGHTSNQNKSGMW